jgi:hypothetical protein
MITTEEQIKEIFQHFKPNSLEHVNKLKDLHLFVLKNAMFFCVE